MFTCKIHIESNEDLEHISALIVSVVLYAVALSSTRTSICWKANLAKNKTQIYSNIIVREKNSENCLQFAVNVVLVCNFNNICQVQVVFLNKNSTVLCPNILKVLLSCHLFSSPQYVLSSNSKWLVTMRHQTWIFVLKLKEYYTE